MFKLLTVKFMFKHKPLLSLLLCLMLAACSTVAITGRKQLNLIPASTMMSMSYQQYSEVIRSSKLSSNAAQTAMVKRCGERIQKAVEQYFAQNNQSQQLRGFEWEFNLIESEQVNAWCMPGGKVAFYTGILPLTRDETGLAVVMGHEIAHAVAEHGSERMSQGLLAQFGGMALDKALESKPDATRALLLGAFGAGAQLGVLLPFSRLQESEADRLGLIFMAMAGYDPNEAINFWQRMATAKGGQAPPEFLSTHPSDETRIRQIRDLLPEAMSYKK